MNRTSASGILIAATFGGIVASGRHSPPTEMARRGAVVAATAGRLDEMTQVQLGVDLNSYVGDRCTGTVRFRGDLRRAATGATDGENSFDVEASYSGPRLDGSRWSCTAFVTVPGLMRGQWFLISSLKGDEGGCLKTLPYRVRVLFEPIHGQCTT